MKLFILISLVFIILLCIYSLIKLLITRKKLTAYISNPNKYHNSESNFIYQDRIKIIGLLNPIGIWTRKILQEKAQLIENQLANYDPKEGYYVNLILAQKFLKNEKKNGFFK